jgi:hypothetical protein
MAVSLRSIRGVVMTALRDKPNVAMLVREGVIVRYCFQAGNCPYLDHKTDSGMYISLPDCPSDAFATAASLAESWVAGRGIVLYPGVAVDGGGTGESTGIPG